MNAIGRYSVLAPLARGGMAELFLSRFEPVAGFEKIVVVKLLRDELARSTQYVELFRHEAHVMLGLVHPNIAQVFDVGECEQRPFLVMEYVPGCDLRVLLKRAARRGIQIPLGDAIAIGIGACAGLHYAHEQRGADGRPLDLVHRDVTPGNVLVSFDGTVKLVDFGIAKSSLRDRDTSAGELRGTLPYLSPEQCGKQPIDRRSDLFSLCALLYEISTGSRLHDAKSDYEVMRQIMQVPPPAPGSVRSDYPAGLAEIVVKGLGKDPAERWATAQELQIALEELAAAERIRVSPLSLARTVRELRDDSIDTQVAGERVTAPTLRDAGRLHESEPMTIYKSAAHRAQAMSAERRSRGGILLALADDIGVWAGELARREALRLLPEDLDVDQYYSVAYLSLLVEHAAAYGFRPSQVGALVHPRIRGAYPAAFTQPVRSVADIAAAETAWTRTMTDQPSSFRFAELGPTAVRVTRVANSYPCGFVGGLLEGLFLALGLAVPVIHEVRCRWVDGGDCTYDLALDRPVA
ncbi:MAG TPA: serine/threonine-protein kinase [Kofleriaceae bacterium]|nr:serine/threonine-protein kinase [Kofleriaceae bacterium]